MRKPSHKLILRQIRLNIKYRNKKIKIKLTGLSFDKEVTVKFPKYSSISNPAYRAKLLKALKHIHIRDTTNKPIFLDFKNVELLYPDGAIYVVQKLDKLSNKLNIKGRSSSFTTVRAMLSKLGIHKLMKVAEYSPTKLLKIVERWNIIEGIIIGLLRWKVFKDSDDYQKITQFLPLESMSNLIKEPFSRLSVIKNIEETIGGAANVKDYGVHWYSLLIVLCWIVIFVLMSYKILKKRDL